MKNKNVLFIIAAAVLLSTSGCVTKEYSGYAGYHTYKKDTDAKTRAVLLSFMLLPLVSIPAVYLVNDLYLHNDTINTLFTAIGLDSFFKELKKGLL
jgi:hypothetical protein